MIETATGKDMGVILRNSFDPEWRDDQAGFYYRRFKELSKDVPRERMYQDIQVCYHKLGTEAAMDPLVFGTEAPGGAEITSVQQPSLSLQFANQRVYAVVGNGAQKEFSLYSSTLEKLDEGKPEWKKLFGTDSGITEFYAHNDDLYLICFKGAPRGTLLHVRADAPDLVNADVLISPGEDVVENAVVARDALYIKLLNGGVERLQRLAYAAGAKPQDIALPVVGTIGLIGNLRMDGVVLRLNSWVNAGGFYACDPATGNTTDTLLQPHGPYDQPADLIVEEVRKA